MTIEILRQIAIKLPETTEDIKWNFHLCFNIGNKMYLVTSPDLVPPSASFKTNPEEFEKLISRPGFTPHSHQGKNYWVEVTDISLLTLEEWENHIRLSYELVASGLSKKFQREIGVID